MKNIPLFSSMHTHTLFCDGKDNVETMCRAAYEKKLYAIGFSSHAPITKKTGLKSEWHLNDERIDEYVTEVLAAKQRWQGKLVVYLGLEVDYIKGLCSAQDSDIKALNADYLIGGVHYIIPPNGAEPFTVDGPLHEFNKGLSEGFGGDGEMLMHYYYDAVAEMTELGGFDILGHADIIKKNRQDKIYWDTDNEAVRQKKIAQITAEAGLIAEVNTGGLNNGKTHDVYPSLSFLHYFRENNVPVIITADAHCAEDIDKNYNIAIQTLINAKFTEHLIYMGKDGDKKLWQKEILCDKGLD
jgi:histidinol-phosphatase (PHP family)